MIDVIIVGAGLAGAIAAYRLAAAGKEVLLLERGPAAGSKNISGGRLYTHSLEQYIPGFTEHAPLERRVTREKLSLLTPEEAVTLEFHSPASSAASSYTVLRASFDRWLIDTAVAAGAQCLFDVRVDRLHVKDGRVCGVEADGDVLEAAVVIVADGVNSLLAQSIGLCKKIPASAVAIGVKEVIELPPGCLEQRFALANRDEGVAWLFAGAATDNLHGGGFLYTNKDNVSLGLVVGLEAMREAQKTLPQLMADFKKHPHIAPLIAGGSTLEYAAHLVPEAGLAMLPDVVGEGVLLAGDACGLCINSGYTIRGMDLAIESGALAAQAILDVDGDYSKARLMLYKVLLDNSFVMRDMQVYRNMPAFLANPRIFKEYPQLAVDIMSDLYKVDGSNAELFWKKLNKRWKAAGYRKLLRDLIQGGRSL